MSSVNGLTWLGASAAAHALFVLLVWGRAPAVDPGQAAPLGDAAPFVGEWIEVAEPETPALARGPAPLPAEAADPDRPHESEATPAAEAAAPEAPRPETPRQGQAQQKPEAPAVPPATRREAPTPPAAAARPAEAPRAAESEGEDWLSIDDQLPVSEPVAKPPPEPAKDPIVERLLAAERRKAEAGQRRALAEAASRPEPPPAPRPATAVERGTVDLAEGFTRAVTEAEKANPVWAQHPLGLVGRVKVRLSLDAGKLGEPEFQGAPHPLLKRLVEKTLRLLRRGSFALPFTPDQNGSRWFEIEVRVSVVDDVNRYAYERPTPTRPGRAYFVLPNGRSFEAFVDPRAAPP